MGCEMLSTSVPPHPPTPFTCQHVRTIPSPSLSESWRGVRGFSDRAPQKSPTRGGVAASTSFIMWHSSPNRFQGVRAGMPETVTGKKARN